MRSLPILFAAGLLAAAGSAAAQLAGSPVAKGDVNGDGVADLIAGAGAGMPPMVVVTDGKTGAKLQSFLAYPATFKGGVRVAVGDVNGDGAADIVTGAGPGAGPHVKVFDGKTGAVIRSWMAYEASYSGGVSVAVQDRNGDGAADIITTASPNAQGLAHVKVFSGKDGSMLSSSFAPGRPGRRN